MNTNKTYNGGLATFSIQSNGTDISDTVYIIDINILLKTSDTDEAHITIIGDEVNDFLFDNEITISLGYDAKNKKVFTGKVISKKFTINPTQGKTLDVICKSSTTLITTKSNQNFDLTIDENILETQFEINENSIQGEIKTEGTYYTINDTVKLKGFDTLFFEKTEITATITNIIHEVGSGNWISTITVNKTD